MAMVKIRLEAPAKINPYLEVGPLRPDGYHSVRTLMQAVELCDIVEAELAEGKSGIELEVEGDAPRGEENLCLRCAAAFGAATGVELAGRIRLVKRIPLAAGLGGGSSDAAAVLRALDRAAGARMDRGELFRLAASVGTDVPFFLLGGTALGEGRGERVTPLAQAPPLPVLLLNPGTGLSTREVYARFDARGGEEAPVGGVGDLAAALARGDVAGAVAGLHNSLQRAAREMLPEIGELLELAARAGAPGALVSGSGPTVFVLASDEGSAEKMERRLAREVPLVVRTRFRGSGVRVVEG